MPVLKKISWIFILLFTTACLTGCGDDNEHEDDTVDTDYITGKWQAVSSRQWEVLNGKIIETWENDEGYDFSTIEFKEDATGECTDVEVNLTLPLTWQITNGKNLYVGVVFGGQTTTLTYKIKTLTNNKLVLRSEEGNQQHNWQIEQTFSRIN